MDDLPLDGLRILDLTRLLPGPMCTLYFADLGADVIKIEDPRGGDYARYYPPLVGDFGAFFASVNRNKRSMTLNLKTPEGVAVLERLVGDADVLVESFRPGVLDRLGVGWERLHELNPRLVVCAISGYGQTGPLRDRAGHDVDYLARAGILGQNGKVDGPVVLPGFQLADIAGGALFAAVGILSALLGRERTGEGRFVDVSMTEGALSFAIPALANLGGGQPQARGDGMLSGGIPAYDVYETKDGRYLALGALEPKFWAGFVQVVGRPDLLGDGLATGDEGRAAKAAVAETLAEKTLAEWTEIFASADVCAEPVMTYEEVLADAHHAARKMFFQLAGVQHVRTPLTPIDREHTPAPSLGANTEGVLTEAGFSDDEISSLRQAGAI